MPDGWLYSLGVGRMVEGVESRAQHQQLQVETMRIMQLAMHVRH